MAPRTFASFAEGIGISYAEELSGEAFFSTLAERFEGRQNQALTLLAQIEARTAEAIRPVIDRHGVCLPDEDYCRSEGRREAMALADISWHDLIAMMVDTYPAFVAEFAAIHEQASADGKAATRLLIEHEEVMLAFANRETEQDPASHLPLVDFLSRF